MKITYHAAASRDGFIAQEDGDVSWLDELNITPDETGLADFFAEVGGLVMGRKTYDFVFDYGSWPYEDKPAWVCTSRELVALDGATLFRSSTIESAMKGARDMKIDHLWLLGGGQLASAFLNLGILTNVSIAEMPITLGTGIPLFAAHKLEKIAPERTEIHQKSGFRQIDVVVG